MKLSPKLEPLYIRWDDGTGGFGGGGVGGGGGKGGGGLVPANLGALTSSGGLTGLESKLVVPMFDNILGNECLATFDFDDFNTEEDCFYKYRVEELQPGRYATVKMVQIVYRNLGPAIINVMIKGIDENNKISSVNKDFNIGATKDINELYELDGAQLITVKRPQLIISRKADSGPLSITRVTLVCELGEGKIL